MTVRPSDLRTERRAQGLTQYTLARRAKVSMRTVVSIETGQAKPRHETQRKLLRALGIPWLLREKVFPK